MCKECWNSVEGSSYECWIMVLYNLYKKQGILGSVFPFLFILDIADWRLSLDAGNVTYLLVNLDVFACVSYRMGIAEVHLLVLL